LSLNLNSNPYPNLDSPLATHTPPHQLQPLFGVKVTIKVRVKVRVKIRVKVRVKVIYRIN
jgi:hypothetical protein